MLMKSLTIIFVASCFTSMIWAQDEGGEPLDDSTSDVEDSFDSDVSSVRVHSDGATSSASESQGARAQAGGSSVGLTGSTSSGNDLIAHELTHVVQQQSRATDNDEEADEPESQMPARVRGRVDDEEAASRRRVRRNRPDQG